MPKFIYKGRFVSYTLAILLSILFMVMVKFNLTYFLISTNVWPEGPETTTFTFNYALQMMLGEFYVVSFVTAIKITIDWFGESKRAAKLEKAQLESELRFLRAQISPHFFFNTLNNIYSLSIEKSNKAPETIMKLSQLMRYMLYETKGRKQSLKKEILCIQDYLDLERIRYGDSVKINMDISGDIEDKKIAPMLLLTFIENCFKHGADKSIQTVIINIDFSIVGDLLYFRVENTLPERDNIVKLPKDKSGGIGINNVKKRLELGYTKDEYDLKTFEANDMFVVELKIKLK